MRLPQVCLAAFLLVVSVATFGDTISDPKIIIHGVNGGNAPFGTCPPEGCTHVGTHFNFSVPDHGSGTLFFTNTSGQNWTSLALIENKVPAADITCVQNLFLSCTEKTLKNGSVEILLSGVNGTHNPQTGILNGQSFAISFVCVQQNGGKSCWPGGLNFTAGANGTIPEPGTVALMVTGLGAIVSRRKKWKNRFNS